MSKCRQCNVIIQDETDVCPLCQCVVERDDTQKNHYPDVRYGEKKRVFWGHLVLFGILIVSFVLTGLNYKFYDGFWWCPIPIAILAYVYLVLRYGFWAVAGYRSKVIVLTICGLLLLVLIDILTGFYGWSVNYAVPGGILFVDIGVVVLMIVNMRNWQSYIIIQIAMIFISLCPILLWKMNIITHPFFSIIVVGITVLIMLGTFLIGDKKAKSEIKRRFHIR